jgi:hypothetical protein
MLPGRVEHVERTAADNRRLVNGVLWVLRSGAHWSDLPERYGKYKSIRGLCVGHAAACGNASSTILVGDKKTGTR